MATMRKSAITAGVLFFVASASYLAGSALVASALQVPDYLQKLNNDQIRVGVLLEFINSAAVVGIAVLLLPVLREYSESMALGYAAARIMEAVLLLGSGLSALALVTLRDKSQGANATQFQTLGVLLIGWYDLAFQLALVVLGAGSLLLCYILYRFQLVPRPLAVLGFVGYLALIASGWLHLFGRDIGPVPFAPGAVFEIVFPLWLILRGINASRSQLAEAGTVSPSLAAYALRDTR